MIYKNGTYVLYKTKVLRAREELEVGIVKEYDNRKKWYQIQHFGDLAKRFCKHRGNAFHESDLVCRITSLKKAKICHKNLMRQYRTYTHMHQILENTQETFNTDVANTLLEELKPKKRPKKLEVSHPEKPYIPNW